MPNRIRIIENMKAIMGMVADIDWRQKANSFILRLEEIITVISDFDFYAYCQKWEEELLTPILPQIYQTY